MNDISPFIAFAGGLVSLLSPCILPMVPVYFASLCGPEILQNGIKPQRLTTFLHSLSFVIGFSLVFILLGTGAGLIGFTISSNMQLVRWISGGLMIVFGLFMLAAPKVSWLNYEKRLTTNKSLASGYVRSLLLGILFALAWTPCVGPVLAGILSLALNSESAGQGGVLLAFYSLGVGLPLLVIGLVFDSIVPWLRKLNKYSQYVYIGGGLLLVIVGVLILFNKLSWFAG